MTIDKWLALAGIIALLAIAGWALVSIIRLKREEASK